LAAVFTGPFGLEAAAAVAAGPEPSVPDVIERLLGLVAKSLVVAGGEGAVTRYRLLDMTRAYAFEKLAESGERARLSHYHTEYYRHLFERAEVEWETRPTVAWLDNYGWCITPSTISFAFNMTSACRRASTLRGFFGCRDFRMRRSAGQ
jgi:predicted ATPase